MKKKVKTKEKYGATLKKLWKTKSFREKMKVANKRTGELLTKRNKVETLHGRWTGDDCSYTAIHKWVRKHLGTPNLCENCRKTKLRRRQYHWANISGEYKRELRDWVRLCVSCHSKFDRNRK